MSQSNPNILILYPDQMRHDVMACAGNPVIKTPFLDQLANEGVHFTNAHVSYPLCCPFRASLMTGKYAQSHGMTQNHFPIDTNQDFLANMLKGVGYQTGYVGKWHLAGGPKPGFVPLGEGRLGFDDFVGFNRGHQYLRSIFYRDTEQPYHCTRYEPDFQTDHIIEFIEKAVRTEPERPFFGFVGYGPPHHPNNMPDHWRNMYDPAEIPLPPGVPNPELQRLTQQQRFEIDCEGNEKAKLRSRCAYGAKKPDEPETEAEIRQFIAEYYGMVSNLDWNIGRILNTLTRLGISDNTMVIFLSDHGDMLGQHGYYCGYKPTGHRAAMQVPFIVRYPARFGAGRKVDALIDVAVDTMPTLLELCGVDIPEVVQGVSYLGLLDGTAVKIRDYVAYQTFKMVDGVRGEFTPVPERGIRTLDWLYVRQPNRRKLLFDQNADPDELNNLVNDLQYSNLMAQFDAQIAAHMQATGDDWEMHADFPPPNFLTHEEGKRYIDEVLHKSAIVVN
ncbi:MAG: sulfatase [Chloroflexota bacterium]